MSRTYLLRYPLESHRDQIQGFLAAHPKGNAIRQAILSLKTDPRPVRLGYAEIDPTTEIAFLAKTIGIPVDHDTETILKRYAPRCRIMTEACEIVYDIDEDSGIVFLFSAQQSK